MAEAATSPVKLRSAAICAFFAVVAFYVWSGGASFDERVARIVANWTKTGAVVLTSGVREIKSRNRTEYVYPTTVAFRPAGRETTSKAELVFAEPKRVGEIVYIYFDPTKVEFSRDDLESAERVASALSADRRVASSLFFGAGVLLSVISIALAASYFLVLERRRSPATAKGATAETQGIPVQEHSTNDSLKALFHDSDPPARVKALDSLDGTANATDFAQHLVQVMTKDPSARVREAASRAVVRMLGGEATVNQMIGLLNSPDAKDRQVAVVALGSMGTSIRARLLPLVQHPSPDVRRATLEILHRFELWDAPTEQ
jgi:HEAT repeat protein